MMKKRCLLALCLLLCAVWCVTAASADAQLRGYDKKDKYQYVSFGVYPQEADGTEQPVLWRVLEVKDGQALMLAEYVLDACPVLDVTDEKVIKNRTYRRISSIEESDMYPWMNTVMATRMFSPAELAALDDSRGVVFNLTAEEYCKPAFGFTRAVYGAQKVRQCNCTEYAMSVGVYREGKAATYWVNKVRSANGYMLQIVGVDGHMSYGAYPRRNIGVRPAVLVKLADVSA